MKNQFLVRLTLLLTILMLSVTSFAQLQQVWKQEINGPASSDDGIQYSLVDNDGNIFTTEFINDDGHPTDVDVWVCKYSPSGGILFRKKAPLFWHYFLGGFRLDNFGNPIIYGNRGSSGNAESFVVVLEKNNGTILWEKYYDKATIGAIEIDEYNNIYAFGNIDNTLQGKGNDALLMKYSSTGNQDWVQTSSIYQVANVGSENDEDYASKFKRDNQGNIYTIVTDGSSSGNKILLQKYNPSGVAQWHAYINEGNLTSLSTHGMSQPLAIDGAGNVHLALNAIITPQNMQEIGIYKYNNQGILQWKKFINGPYSGGNDGSIGLLVDNAGAIYTGGTLQTAEYEKEISAIKLASDGTILWSTGYPSPFESGGGVNPNNLSELSFDNSGNFIFRGSGQTMLCFLKYSPTGNSILTKICNDGIAFGNVKKSVLDAAGNLYIIGNLPDTQDYDWLIKKYDANGNFKYDYTCGGTANGYDMINNVFISEEEKKVALVGYFNNLGTNSDVTLIQYEEVPFLMCSDTNQLSNAFATAAGTTSLSKSFFIRGDQLIAPVQITAPESFKLSLTGLPGTYVSTITLSPIQGGVNSTKIYVAYTPIASGNHTGSVIVASDGISSDIQLNVSGMTEPTITTSGQLGLFVSQPNTSSIIQKLVVSGFNLTANVTITAPLHFQVSLTSNEADFSNQVHMPITGNLVGPDTLYIKYVPNVVGDHSGNIAFQSGVTTGPPITVNGTTNAGISVVANLTSFSSGVDVQSEPQPIAISAANLTGNITVTASANFLISPNPTGVGAVSSLNIPHLNGSLAPYKVWVIYKPTAISDSHSGTITFTSPGAATQSVPVSGNSVPSVEIISSMNPFLVKINVLDLIQTFVVNARNVPASGLVLNTAGVENFSANFTYNSQASPNNYATTKIIYPDANKSIVDNRTIYLKYTPFTASLNVGNITINDGLTTHLLAVSGDSRPTVNPVSNFTQFSTDPGVPSTEQSLTLSGINIAGNVTVVAPANFRISKMSGGPYTASISFDALTEMDALGKLSEKTVYMVYNPTIAGTHQGNVAISTAGLATITIPVSGVSDFEAPVVTFNPANGANNFPRNGTITISFNENIRTIDDFPITNSNVANFVALRVGNAAGAVVPTTVTISNNTISIDPTNDLNPSQQYYVALVSVEDNSNNAIPSPSSITFTTAGSLDATAPVVSFIPVNGTSNVSVSDNIIVNFTEPVRKTDNTVITNLNLVSILTLKETNSSGVNVNFTATINEARTQIIIDPIGNFKPSQAYYVSVNGIEDASDNASLASSATFTTGGDTQAPQILDVVPANAATNVPVTDNIIFSFDEAVRRLDNNPISNQNIIFKLNNSSGASVQCGFNFNNNKLTINPSGNLNYLQTYYLELTGLEDIADNAMPSASIVFTTVGSPDATLSNLTLNSGTLDPLFQSYIFNYHVLLPYGTTQIPNVVAVKNNSAASVVIDPADNLTGTEAERTTTITVTAQDGVAHKQYTVTFELAPSNDATLNNISLNQGMLSPTFSSLLGTYIVYLPNGTVDVPTVTPTKNDMSATVLVSNALNITGTQAERTTTITVTAEDGITQKVYKVIFAITPAKANQTITFDNIPDKFDTDQPFVINASSDAGLPVLFTIIEGNNIATLDNNIITLTGELGEVTVQCIQVGNDAYNAAVANQSFSVIRGQVLSVNATSSLPLMVLSPNPAKEQIFIRAEAQIAELAIMDISGRIIHQTNNVNRKECQLNLVGYDAGTYIVKITTDNHQVLYRRLIIQ